MPTAITTPPSKDEFDEAYYAAKYPDVAAHYGPQGFWRDDVGHEGWRHFSEAFTQRYNAEGQYREWRNKLTGVRYVGANPVAGTGNVLSRDEARGLVRDRYLFYLKREPDATGWDTWTDNLMNLANTYGRESALAELNHAFATSEEYITLHSVSPGQSAPDQVADPKPINLGVPDRAVVTGTTPPASGGIMDTISNLSTPVKVIGGIAIAAGLAMLAGGGKK